MLTPSPIRSSSPTTKVPYHMKMSRVIKLLKSFPKLFKQHNPSIDQDQETQNGVQLPKIKVTKTKSQFPERFNKSTMHFPKLRSKTKSLKMDREGSKSESNLSEVLHHNNNFLSHNNLVNTRGISKSNNSLQNKIGAFESNKHSNKVPGHSSDVPRIVAEAIADATGSSQNLKNSIKRPSQMERLMVRIINGCDPSCQSQILLNTRTSQPWEDLVRDLGMSVKLQTSKKAGNRLETLYGRKVKSYSQLRSELKVGNTTFYSFYESDDEEAASELMITAVPNLQKHRLSFIAEQDDTSLMSSRRHRVRRRSNASLSSHKIPLEKTFSTSSSELSYENSNLLRVPSARRRSRRKSRTPSPSSRSPTRSIHDELARIESQSRSSVHF